MANQIFITGATGGLGKAFAVDCARRGWDLWLTDISAGGLEALANSLKHTYSVRVSTYASDLTDLESRNALIENLYLDGILFNMIINVAGVDYEGVFTELSSAEIRKIVRLNVEATLEITHALLERVDPLQPFRIINVSSLAAFYPMPVKATYAASKRFLLDFSLALRQELRDRGVTVTVLCPAGMPTTESCIEAIEAQGIMGQLTTMDIGVVASKTIDRALKGRGVYIPGVLNQAMQLASSVIPRGTLAALIGSRWMAAHRKRVLAAQEG